MEYSESGEESQENVLLTMLDVTLNESELQSLNARLGVCPEKVYSHYDPHQGLFDAIESVVLSAAEKLFQREERYAPYPEAQGACIVLNMTHETEKDILLQFRVIGRESETVSVRLEVHQGKLKAVL